MYRGLKSRFELCRVPSCRQPLTVTTVFPPALTPSHYSFQLFLSLSSLYPLSICPFPHCPVFSKTFCLSFLFAILCLTLFPLFFFFFSVILTPSALRSCSTGDSLLSSAFIRSAKSAPALAPPLPVLLHHHHHPLLPPLADQLAGTLSLHYLSPCKL